MIKREFYIYPAEEKKDEGNTDQIFFENPTEEGKDNETI